MKAKYCSSSTSLTIQSSLILLADAEVAADGERLGLLLDLGLELDFGLCLWLAIDLLRTRRIRVYRFAHRASGLSLAVGATAAHQAVAFDFAVGAGGARRALALHLAVRAGFALRTAAFQLALGAGVARHTPAFHRAVRTRVALHVEAFQPAVGTRVAIHAVAFLPPVRAPLLSSHSSRTLTSVFAPQAAPCVVAKWRRLRWKSRCFSGKNSWTNRKYPRVSKPRRRNRTALPAAPLVLPP